MSIISLCYGDLAIGILIEHDGSDGRAVIWFPDSGDGTDRVWHRLVVAPLADARFECGLRTLAATSVRVRRRVRGLWMRLADRLRGGSRSQEWEIPGYGGVAERVSERRTDLILVWQEAAISPLGRDRILGEWPHASILGEIGPGLFLVSGVVAQRPVRGITPYVDETSPRSQCEIALSAAREVGDQAAEATALADLGIALIRDCNIATAIASFEDAVSIFGRIGLPARESDTLFHLGKAVESRGDTEGATSLWERALTLAREGGDPFAEKQIEECLAQSSFRSGGFDRALKYFANAARRARLLGDVAHESLHLWSAGLCHAELGRRDQAIGLAEHAVALMTSRGDPRAAWYADHLAQYRLGAGVLQARSPNEPVGRSPEAGGGPAPSAAPLRMALTAAASLAKFAGSGMKFVSAEIKSRRVSICKLCDHHTGRRCRVCGCFTELKARFPYENCPLEKWPTVSARVDRY